MTTQPAASPFPEPGAVLAGRYELEKELGRGGYSVVYAGRDRELDTHVAIKLLVPPPAGADVAKERMRREVQAIRRLTHPHVVRVFDMQEDGHWSFLVMERCGGADLAAEVLAHGPLETGRVVTIGRAIAGALGAAHQHGILHRDVKPQNILLDTRGPKLVDFGSARMGGATLTRTGGLVGTLQYTAPELLRGRRGDPRADLYALGVTLYFAVTGSLPPGATAHSPPLPSTDGYHPGEVRDDVPAWLDAVIARATASSPEDRWPTAQTLESALEGAGSGNGPLAATPDAEPSCLICEGPDPFGVSICPACGGAAVTGSDTLVFVRPPSTVTARREVAATLGRLMGTRTSTDDIAWTARGHRALLAIGADAAERVRETLERRAIPIRTAPSSRWTAVPWTFTGLLLGVGATGVAAGAVAVPAMLWGSPVVVGLLWLAAQRRLKEPLVSRGGDQLVLSAETHREVVEALSSIGPGAARDLLADLVRSVLPLYRLVARAAAPDIPVEDLDALLRHACGAARDLHELDDSLGHLEDQAPTNTATAAWAESMTKSERYRDRLVHHLLHALALVRRLRLEAARNAADASGLRTLLEDLEHHAEARRELEALLSAA